MKYLFSFFILLFFPLGLYSYFNYENCENETVFFVQSIEKTKMKFSSFYCDFWAVQEGLVFKRDGVKWGMFASYNRTQKILTSLSKEEQIEYLRRLKTDLENIKNDEKTKSNIFEKYTKNYRNYEDTLSVFFKKYIFSKYELVAISVAIQNHPYKKFEKSLWERLLMNGEIISREEWWADESFSKKEVYMKGCEDGSCYAGWPVAPNQLKDNYLAYFNAQDAKDRIIKNFDDGRDALRYYPVDRIIIHHTAWGYQANKQEWLAYMKSVQKYHALRLRWGDVWYHYLIDGEGNIYEWKSGGKYVLWSHVVSHNYGSIWVSLMSDGYYSDAMLESLQKLVIYLWKEYDLDLGKKTLVRNSNLTGWEEWWAVLAHKELDARKPKDPEINMDVFREQIVAKLQWHTTVSKK